MRHGEQCGPDAHRFHNKTTVHAEVLWFKSSIHCPARDQCEIKTLVILEQAEGHAHHLASHHVSKPGAALRQPQGERFIH